jgi:hypothetical protein
MRPLALRPAALAVKPRLIRQLFLPPLIILLMVGLGGWLLISETMASAPSAKTANASWSCMRARSKAKSANTPTCPACWSWKTASRTCSPTRPRNTPDGQRIPRRPEPAQPQPGHLRPGHHRPGAGHQQLARRRQFLGEDLSFRAYFQTAVRGEPGRFYGIGSTTARPATTWPMAWKNTARSSASPWSRCAWNPGRTLATCPPGSLRQRRERHHHPLQRPGPAPQVGAPAERANQGAPGAQPAVLLVAAERTATLARETLADGVEN